MFFAKLTECQFSSKMLCRNICYLRCFYIRSKYYRIVVNTRPVNVYTTLTNESMACMCTCQRAAGDIERNDKNKESKCKFSKFENLVKNMSVHFADLSMSRVFTFVHIEMPKNIPNVLDYLSKKMEKQNILILPENNVKRLEEGNVALKLENTESTAKNDEEINQSVQSEVVSKAQECLSQNIKHERSNVIQNDSKDQCHFPASEVNDLPNMTLKDQVVTGASGALNSTVNAVLNFSNYFSVYRKVEDGNLALKLKNAKSTEKHDEVNCQSVQSEAISEAKECQPLKINHNNPKDQSIVPKIDEQPNVTLKDQMVTGASGALSSTVNAVLNLSNYFNRKMDNEGLKSMIKTETTKSGQQVMRVFSGTPDMEIAQARIRHLVYNLSSEDGLSDEPRIQTLRELSDHFITFPDARKVALEGKLVPCLLKLRDAKRKDPTLSREIHRALALVGYVPPLRSKGVRILSLDGGGMRGLISLEILRQLEQRTDRRVHEMFDYVCGVSTGSLIGALTCVYKMTLDEAEDVYMKVSKKVFERNRVYGAGTLVWDSAFYDTKVWQRELTARLGEKSFVDIMGDPTCPKMSVVSTLMNVGTIRNFLFRNYEFHPSKRSRYLGSIEHKLWEATRASSAAPWYFEEFKLQDYIHQDGGLLTNNPTGIAVQESRLIWKDEDIHCVVSIGTGKHLCPKNDEPKLTPKSSFKDKISKIVESATDTEAVHAILKDTLSSSTYFRFNPPTSEVFGLDEISETKWIQMRRDAVKYCNENQIRLDEAAKQLLVSKNPLLIAKDWVTEKIIT